MHLLWVDKVQSCPFMGTVARCCTSKWAFFGHFLWQCSVGHLSSCNRSIM